MWAPKAIAAGWKYWALLPPQQTIGHANMARLVETYASKGVTVAIFREVSDALDWLRKQGS